MEPTFEDLIPAPVSFDDLIPNPGAPWPLSSLGAGAVDIGDAGVDVGTPPPSDGDGGTVVGPFQLRAPAAAGGLDAAFGATHSPFTATFPDYPAAPEAGGLTLDGPAPPAWAALAEIGPTGQFGDWPGPQVEGGFGGDSDGQFSAPDSAPTVPATPSQASRSAAASPPNGGQASPSSAQGVARPQAAGAPSPQAAPKTSKFAPAEIAHGLAVHKAASKAIASKPSFADQLWDQVQDAYNNIVASPSNPLNQHGDWLHQFEGWFDRAPILIPALQGPPRTRQRSRLRLFIPPPPHRPMAVRGFR